jgi:hypothetical protein
MNNNAGNQGGEDYLDKALDKVEQMAGKKVRCKPLHSSHSSAIANRTDGSSLAVRPPSEPRSIPQAERESDG